MRVQIPDEALDQLERLLEEDGGIQWEIGDFLVAFWEEMKRYLPTAEQKEAHAELIRQFATGTRADRTTLRDRKAMSVFFPVRVRDRFPMFSYHQFRALRSAGEEDWWAWAELAADEGWSVAKIRKQIKGEEDPLKKLLEELDSIEAKALKIIFDETQPVSAREGLVLIPTIIQDVKETL